MLLPEQLPFQLPRQEGVPEVVLERLLRSLPPRRATYVGSFGGTAAIIKLFSTDEPQARRDYAREVEGLTLLTRAGLPTPELLFSGPAGDGASLVVTRYLDGSEDLLSLIQAPPGRMEELEVGHQLGVMMARLHRHRLIHRDAHLGNFLCWQKQVVLIDGGGIGRNRALFKSRANLTNLALLLAQLPVNKGGLAGALMKGYGVDYRAIGRYLNAQRRARERRYLKKSLRSCTEFKAEKGEGRRVVVRRELTDDPDMQHLLQNPDRAIEHGQPLKQGNSATLARIRERPWVIKRYNIKSSWHRWRLAFRRSRASSSWLNGYRLRMWGLSTPLPLALIEQRIGWFPDRAYLVMEYSPSSSCTDYLKQDDAKSQQVIDELVLTTQQLQLLGLSHGDMKVDNLLYSEKSITLLDLDSLRRWRHQKTLRRAIAADQQRLLRNWDEAMDFHRRLSQQLKRANTIPMTGFTD